jgi:hypothetical protein
LSRDGTAPETRSAAQLQLAMSLRQRGLDRAALSLFADAAAPETLDVQARYALGSMAESRGAPAAAVRYWADLPAPQGTGAEEWQVRIAAVQWRAGLEDATLATMRAVTGQGKALPDPAAGRALALAREMLDGGKSATAEALYSMLLPLLSRAKARDVLVVLGEIAESGARFAAAADFFLRAALADESRAADAQASQARLAAAANLARAGYREDARAQYQWLLKHSRNSAQIEAARRELARP